MSAAAHFRGGIALLVLVGVVLSACGGGNSPAPTALPPSAEALDFDILQVEGPWLLRLELELTPPDVPATLRYTGTISFWVQLDGSINGSGQLTPNITNTPCVARVISDALLGVQVSGHAYARDRRILAALELQPNDPAQDEGYVLQCGAGVPAQYVIRPVLWPALQALGRTETGDFTLEGLRWSVPLRGDALQLERELGAGRGRLTGTVRVERG